MDKLIQDDVPYNRRRHNKERHRIRERQSDTDRRMKPSQMSFLQARRSMSLPVHPRAYITQIFRFRFRYRRADACSIGRELLASREFKVLDDPLNREFAR